MRAWTVQDEINLCKWVDDRGFKKLRVLYMPLNYEDLKIWRNKWNQYSTKRIKTWLKL